MVLMLIDVDDYEGGDSNVVIVIDVYNNSVVKLVKL